MQPCKVLMVVSRDFGELSFALSFARCAGINATLLLPDNLQPTRGDLYGVPNRGYRSLDDILREVEALQPDAVMLFSGYLFSIGGLLDPVAVHTLVGALAQRRIPVLTSDPFLGLPFGDPARPFEINLPHGAAMVQHITGLAKVLQACTHVYTTPCSALQTPKRLACGLPPVLARAHSATARAERLKALPTPLQEDGFWLYVLSGEDFQVQLGVWGEQMFCQLLAQRMGEAHAAGRTPVLVSPAACTQSVAPLLPSNQPALLIPFCEHQQFEDLQLGAEHAFYWNHLSHSLLPRFTNLLPTWFFAEGHLLRAIPNMRAFVHETFYGEFEVVDLDMRTPLDPEELLRLATSTHCVRRALVARYDSMLQPVDLLRLVLSETVGL